MKARQIADASLPSKYGNFRIFAFESEDGAESILALVMGDPAAQERPLVRIHS